MSGRSPLAGATTRWPAVLLAGMLATSAHAQTAAAADPAASAPTAASAPPGPAASEPALPTAMSAPASAPAASPDRVPRLVIDAPDALRKVLAKYLDLARAIEQSDAAALSDFEWSRLTAATPAQVRSLVQPLGFFDAQATLEREPGPPPVVTLHVNAGAQAEVGKLTFEFQGELLQLTEQGDEAAQRLSRSLRETWPLGPGQPFSNDAWSGAKSSVIAHLRAEGYAAASWAGTAAQVDPASGKVRLFIVADSGPLYRAGEVVVDGLVHHDLARVRSLAPFPPGAAMTETQLLAYQERLQKTGLFEQVNVTLDVDPAQAEHARVLVQLREAPRIATTLALGFSANSGPRVTLEHVQRRPLDLPLTMRNKLVWGRSEQSWDGELATHADADFRYWSLGGTIDRLLTDTDLVLSQRLRLGRSRQRDGLERFAFVEGERARECARDNGQNSECVDIDALSTQLHLTWRQLDNALLPTRGYTLQLQGGVGLARGSASARGAFGRLYARSTYYLPLGQSWYAQARLEGGQLFAAPDVKVPDSLRFRAGGDDSVRGYGWRTLAPSTPDGSLTGGRVLWTASAEIARPVSPALPSVWWAAFVDAGRAADHWQDLDPALGYGLGVRWRSPVGPLRLDLAWGQETRKLRLHLSVGIAF